MKTWQIYWTPSMQLITTVRALTAHKAIKKTPRPYSQYLGEIWAKELT